MDLLEILEKNFREKYITRVDAIKLIAKSVDDDMYKTMRLFLCCGIAQQLRMFTLDFFRMSSDYDELEFLDRNKLFEDYISHIQNEDYDKADLLLKTDNIYWFKEEFFANYYVIYILKNINPELFEHDALSGESIFI